MKFLPHEFRRLPTRQRIALLVAAIAGFSMLVVLVSGGIDTSILGIRLRANDWFDPAVVAGIALLFVARDRRREQPATSVLAGSKIETFGWRTPEGLFLATVLGVATLTRFWGLTFGLPHPDARPDEGAVAAIASGFSEGRFEPPGFDWPPFFILVVAAALWLTFVKSSAILARLGLHGWVPEQTMFAKRIMARGLSAIAGVVSVWLLFRVGLRLFGRSVGLVAATFLALAFLHVRDSHFGVTDIPMTFMVVAGFLAIVKVSESGSTGDLVAAAVLTGLGAATKYNAVLLALPASFAILTEPSSRPFGARIGRVLEFGLIASLAFLAACPYAALTPGKFFTDFLKQSRHLSEGHGTELGRGWVYHVTTTLRYGLGVPLFAAGIIGLPLVVWRERRRGLLVVLFPVVYYLLVGSGRTVFARYILPAVPFLCLTAAYAVVTAAGWLTTALRRPEWRVAATAAVAAFVIWPSAASVIAFDRVLAREDSRVSARKWIEERFPSGTSLAQWGQPNGHVYADFEITYRLSPIIRTERPMLIAIVSSPMSPLPNLHEFLPFLEQDYELKFEESVVPENESANIYDLQDEFFLPLTGFRGIERPGPNVRIFVRRAP